MADKCMRCGATENVERYGRDLLSKGCRTCIAAFQRAVPNYAFVWFDDWARANPMSEAKVSEATMVAREAHTLINELDMSVRELESRIERERAAHEATKRELTLLEAKVAGLSDVDKLRAEVERIKFDRDRMDAGAKRLEKEREEILADLDEASLIVQPFFDETELLAAAIKNALKAKDAEVERLRGELETARADCERLKASVAGHIHEHCQQPAPPVPKDVEGLMWKHREGSRLVEASTAVFCAIGEPTCAESTANEEAAENVVAAHNSQIRAAVAITRAEATLDKGRPVKPPRAKRWAVNSLTVFPPRRHVSFPLTYTTEELLARIQEVLFLSLEEVSE